MNEGRKITNQTFNLPNADQSQRASSSNSSCSTCEEVNDMELADDENELLNDSFSKVPKSSMEKKVVDKQSSSSFIRFEQRDLSSSSSSIINDDKIPVNNNLLNSDQMQNNVLEGT